MLYHPHTPQHKNNTPQRNGRTKRLFYNTRNARPFDISMRPSLDPEPLQYLSSNNSRLKPLVMQHSPRLLWDRDLVGGIEGDHLRRAQKSHFNAARLCRDIEVYSSPRSVDPQHTMVIGEREQSEGIRSAHQHHHNVMSGSGSGTSQSRSLQNSDNTSGLQVRMAY